MAKNNNATRPSISESGMRIMRLLIGQPPQTILQMIDSLRITRTAITEQVRELVAAGYVDQAIERSAQRGRPKYLFSATDQAMRQLFEGNQNVVVPAIWRSLRKHFGEEAVAKVCRDVSDEVAQIFIDQITSADPKNRMKEFVNILLGCDRLAEYKEKEGAVEIYKHNCPFISMADDSGALCCIDRLAMQKIIGAPLEVTQSRKDGFPCCTFSLKYPETSPAETETEAV